MKDIKTENLWLMQGDCLERMKEIESGSVDLIVCDLPYGTMDTDGGRKLGINGWDNVIDTNKIMNEANRILRKNGKMLLFAQGAFVDELKHKAIPNLVYNYSAIWEKDNFANALSAKKAMVNYFEDILVFSKSEDVKINPIKGYTNKIRSFINKSNKDIFADFEYSGFKKYAVLDTFNSDKARRYNFPTSETYSNLIHLYEINKMDCFLPYESALKKFREFESLTPSTFNLWQGKKYKSNILKYKKDYDGFHPTQKPVLLLEDLINTFSNEGNLVVDMTMGSGSTGVACVNTNRKFIGIEMDKGYFEIGVNRVAEALL